MLSTFRNLVDLLVFILMGVIGGLFGALWCFLQKQITIYRMSRVNFTKCATVAEAVAVSVLNTSIMFAIMSGSPLVLLIVWRLPFNSCASLVHTQYLELLYPNPVVLINDASHPDF